MKHLSFTFNQSISVLGLPILLICQLFPQLARAGGTGLSGGSFAFCNQSLVSFKIEMQNIKGFSDYEAHINKLSKKLPTLAINLNKVSEFDWYYFPSKNGHTKCRFINNPPSDSINGMDNLGIQIDKPIQFNYSAKQIYIRDDLYSKQKDKGMQLFNEAVRNLCMKKDFPDICVMNTRAVLDFQDRYTSGDEIILQLLRRPYALNYPEYIGFSKSYNNTLIEMAKLKVETIKQLKLVIQKSHDFFIASQSCKGEPWLELSHLYDFLFADWRCRTLPSLFDIDGTASNSTPEIQSLIEENKKLSLEVRNNFIKSIIASYQSQDQKISYIQKYYIIPPIVSVSPHELKEHLEQIPTISYPLTHSMIQNLMDAIISETLDFIHKPYSQN